MALKIYPKYILADPQKMQNVKREISILRRMDHSNVIKMPYAFEDKQQVKI